MTPIERIAPSSVGTLLAVRPARLVRHHGHPLQREPDREARGARDPDLRERGRGEAHAHRPVREELPRGHRLAARDRPDLPAAQGGEGGHPLLQQRPGRRAHLHLGPPEGHGLRRGHARLHPRARPRPPGARIRPRLHHGRRPAGPGRAGAEPPGGGPAAEPRREGDDHLRRGRDEVVEHRLPRREDRPRRRRSRRTSISRPTSRRRRSRRPGRRPARRPRRSPSTSTSGRRSRTTSSRATTARR